MGLTTHSSIPSRGRLLWYPDPTIRGVTSEVVVPTIRTGVAMRQTSDLVANHKL